MNQLECIAANKRLNESVSYWSLRCRELQIDLITIVLAFAVAATAFCEISGACS